MKHHIIALDARCIGHRKTGDTTYWTGLVAGLNQTENQFSYLLISNDSRPPEIPDTPKLRWVQLPGRTSRWWSLVQFPLLARKMGAALVHSQYNMSPLIKKGVSTIHDVSFLIGPEWFLPKDRYLLQKLVPATVKRVRRVITVSETSRQDIERLIPAARGKTRATPLALNPAIQPLDRDTAQRIVSRELGQQAPFILTVGTRWPRKNMQLAVDAAELLPAALSHRLFVTGQPGWSEGASGSRSIATGYVSSEVLSALYSAADLYLAPSRYEGFGLTLLEAFACGAPVLSSCGGSLPEVAGGAAEIEPTWDAAHWGDTLARLLNDSSKLAQMRKRGFDRLNSFSWLQTANLTEAVYAEALA